jgi:Hsp20/alpha crystallin family
LPAVETEYGPFERRVGLADNVDAEQATATYEAGMLRREVPLPDREELPSETRDALHFVLVGSIDEVFDAAFGSNGSRSNGRVRAATAER